jgi:hypothetical protein
VRKWCRQSVNGRITLEGWLMVGKTA